MTAALRLRVRETAVLANVIFGVLLIFCGVNVPLDSLPGWMASVAPWLPLTHGIAAARRLADGASLSSVGGDLLREVAIGASTCRRHGDAVLLRVGEPSPRHPRGLLSRHDW